MGTQDWASTSQQQHQQQQPAAAEHHHLKLTPQLLRQAQANLQQQLDESAVPRCAQLREEFWGKSEVPVSPSLGGQTDRDRHDLINTDSAGYFDV